MDGLIRTVLGDIKSSEAGVCQCHEHLFIEMGKPYQMAKVLYMDDLQKSTDELAGYREAGGSLVVDAQPVFTGRMAENLTAASEKSDVHVVASTGFYKTAFYEEDAYIYHKDENDIEDLYVSEAENGMLSSKKDGHRIISARAGMIKTAIDMGGIYASGVYEKLFFAAAGAAVRTGLPVICHIEQGADALHVVDFFAQRGLAADRLLICHLDRARYDFAYHKEVLGTGAYLEYDTINRPKYLSNRQETDLIVAMLEAGFEDRILLSLDTTNARLRAYGADMGLDYILKEFVPQLKAAGAGESQIKKMQSLNARSALTIKKLKEKK
jgi:phosphotriesterase-related protein